MKTTIPELQSYLTSLLPSISSSSYETFVNLFVPLDCTPSDISHFLKDLQSDTAQWTNLTSEIIAIEAGTNVTNIEETQNKVVFYFTHPILDKCDREVEFVRMESEAGEMLWRAGG
mmetsp:Transcript_21622/g.40684  ORF Transcript_21622/g.40684 Transcript_21622/m.40684 type:complete len:116 (+) Transcript_21622:108-455(+)